MNDDCKDNKKISKSIANRLFKTSSSVTEQLESKEKKEEKE